MEVFIEERRMLCPQKGTTASGLEVKQAGVDVMVGGPQRLAINRVRDENTANPDFSYPHIPATRRRDPETR